jgi:dihydrofolate synthase/folylpolyglutamate synthase
MDYQQVIEYLNSRDLTMSRYEREDFDLFSTKVGLKINFPFIHITGSNGKGSTANYIYQIYRAKGLHVALFSKPFISRPNEMFLFDDKEISDEKFASIFSKEEELIKKSNLSSFEIETYMAFTYFNEVKPDIAIIECGMGGETDSTNLPSSHPLLSIITSVSLEHTAFLGRTVSEIARNKAGIIKDKCPVLVGNIPEAALTTIRDIANSHESDFHTVDDYHLDHYASPYFRFDYRPYKDLAILTPARYQLLNACLAIEATKILSSFKPMDEFSLRKGLLSSPLPARFERHHNILIDGAHNPEAIGALCQCLESYAMGKKIHVLFASFKDKNIAVELPLLANIASDVTLTSFASSRARKEEDYFLYEADYPYMDDYKAALANLSASYPDDLLVVTGSLAFAYLVRSYVSEVLKL